MSVEKDTGSYHFRESSFDGWLRRECSGGTSSEDELMIREAVQVRPVIDTPLNPLTVQNARTTHSARIPLEAARSARRSPPIRRVVVDSSEDEAEEARQLAQVTRCCKPKAAISSKSITTLLPVARAVSSK